MPALVMRPESTALAGLGATGWAVGSQAWRGTIPAFAPKPSRVRNVTARIVSRFPATFAMSSPRMCAAQITASASSMLASLATFM